MDFKKILENFVPYVAAGVGIAICVGLFWLFFSLAVWGLVIGLLLWVGTTVVQSIFPSDSKPPEDSGRIIEHDDKDK